MRLTGSLDLLYLGGVLLLLYSNINNIRWRPTLESVYIIRIEAHANCPLLSQRL